MKRWWPLLAAIVYVIATFAAVFALPKAPGVTASGAALVRYYRDHADTLRTATWLLTWALVPSSSSWRMRARSSRVCVAMSCSSASRCSWRPERYGRGSTPASRCTPTLDAHVTRTLVDISVYFGPILTVADVLLAGAIGLAAWRGDGGLPRWLAYFSAVFALEQAIETITVFGKSGYIAPGGDMNFQLGAGLLIVWLIALGVATSRGPPTPARSRRQ